MLPSVLLATWTALTFAVCLLRGRLSPDNLTRLLILGFLCAALLLLPLWRRLARALPPGRWFVGAAVVSALVVEGCYMISAPLHPSLRITATTGPAAALRNYGIDVLLVTPAYVVLCALDLWLIRRHRYRLWELALILPIGHALGDGQAFFLANPGLLWLLPYVTINYQAMLLPAYLALPLQPAPPPRPRWQGYVLPLLLLPAAYFVCGATLLWAGRRLGLF